MEHDCNPALEEAEETKSLRSTRAFIARATFLKTENLSRKYTKPSLSVASNSLLFH